MSLKVLTQLKNLSINLVSFAHDEILSALPKFSFSKIQRRKILFIQTKDIYLMINSCFLPSVQATADSLASSEIAAK